MKFDYWSMNKFLCFFSQIMVLYIRFKFDMIIVWTFFSWWLPNNYLNRNHFLSLPNFDIEFEISRINFFDAASPFFFLLCLMLSPCRTLVQPRADYFIAKMMICCFFCYISLLHLPSKFVHGVRSFSQINHCAIFT